MARPTKYKPEYAAQAKKLCAIGGFIDEELAAFFEVSRSTLSEWKNEHPEFLDAVKAGKQFADEKVVQALYERACGYEYVEEASSKSGPVALRKKVHADPTSMIFWLKNRQPEKWRDKVQNEHSGPDGGAIPSEIRIKLV